jgi:anti-sigma factor RsiW
MEPAVQMGMPVVAASGGTRVADVAHSVVRARMSEYLANSLGPDERQRIDRHVAACPDCAAYLTTLRKTVELVSTLPPRPAPTGARESIMRRVREHAGQS